MKAQLIILFLLVSFVSTKGFAGNGPQQDDKKTQKSKYDFNIFKLYSITNNQQIPDSLHINLKAIPLKRKED